MSSSLTWKWTKTAPLFVRLVSTPTKVRTECASQELTRDCTGPISSFLNSLGQPVPAAASETSTRPGSRPSTPAAPSQPNPEKVRRSLHELWATEESYLRKITSLAEVKRIWLALRDDISRTAHTHVPQDYATPLRAFSKKRETAIIPAFEATHLFINIDQLVPIAKAFERDLRQIVARAQQDPSRVPAGFGEVILSHVSSHVFLSIIQRLC